MIAEQRCVVALRARSWTQELSHLGKWLVQHSTRGTREDIKCSMVIMHPGKKWTFSLRPCVDVVNVGMVHAMREVTTDAAAPEMTTLTLEARAFA